MAKRIVGQNGNGHAQKEERTVKLQILVDLGAEEFETKSKRLAALDLEINARREEARADAAAHREGIKALVEERDPLATVVKERKELQQVECIQEADFARGVLITRRRKTGEHVEERALEASERERMAQGKLWDDDLPELPEKAKNDVEQPGPQPAA